MTVKSNLNTKTVIVNEPPSNLLGSQPPPPLQPINNIYELKTNPELVQYYNTVVGLPTKTSWITAINNNHYASWTGLDATAVEKYLPESDKM